ncbi:MAG: leucine-rich repeat protein [Bacilli bacterium]|nr:leucine-rich repeat protein [Bacilli bacterium]
MLIENGVLKEVLNSDFKKGFLRIPKEVQVLDKECFKKATKLKKLHIPDSVLTIHADAFKNNYSIKEINLPKYDYEQNWARCGSIKTINIDASIKKNQFSFNFYRLKKFKKINFIYDNKKITLKGKKISKIVKTDDNSFAVYGDPYDRQIIKENEIIKYDVEKAIERTGSIDYFDFNNEFNKANNENFDILIKWMNIMENNKRLKKEKIVNEESLFAVPANAKNITEFFLNYKKLYSVMNKYEFKYRGSRTDFIRMCYVLGFFEGDNKKEVIEFIEKLMENSLCEQFIEKFRGMKFEENGYEPEFAKIVMKDFMNINNTTNGLYYNSNELVDIYNCFKLIKKEIKRETKKITYEEILKKSYVFKFTVRDGNEELFDCLKQYSDEYSTDDFEILQDLYEKAKQIAKLKSKKIIKTIDRQEEYKYEWLDGDNPVNLVLGNKVGCCARVNKIGEGILRASLFNDEVRNLALYGEKGKIIGKATAYYNESGKYILFNNAEVSKETSELEKEQLFNSLIRAVDDEVAVLNKDDLKIEMIVMGMGLNDLKNQIINNDCKIIRSDLKKNLVFVGGSNGHQITYVGDASNPNQGQCVLWENNKQKVR